MMELEQFTKICRICLAEKRTLISIHDPASNNYHAYDIASKLMACAKIQVDEGDNLPSKICLKCLATLNASYDFQLLCEDSDRALRDTLKREDDQIDNSFSNDNDNDNLSDVSVAIKVELDTSEESSLPVAAFVETTLREKRSYVRMVPRREHKCEPCDKIFKDKRMMRRHNLNRHGISLEDQKKHVCKVCQLTFDSWKCLYSHEKECGHHAKVKCHLCDKSFSRAYMADHLRGHAGDKPFLCPQCGESFLHRSTFKKHNLKCANVEKKLKCSYCEQRFHAMSGLRDHERIHSGVKPFVCETCGKAFRRKVKLTQHQLTHTDTRDHPCKTCGRCFRQRSHLKEHMRIHTGIKPYICHLCDASFTQGHSLKTHLVRHGPVQPDHLQ